MSATVEITNDIALIRMDDGKANAINFEMIAALNTALDRLQGAVADSRKRYDLQDTITRRALLAVSMMAAER